MNTHVDVLRIVGALASKSASGSNFESLSQMWPAFEKMADEGATIVFKIDGGRQPAASDDRYTLVVSGGGLGQNFFRKDTADIFGAACEAILFYNESVWKT